MLKDSRSWNISYLSVMTGLVLTLGYWWLQFYKRMKLFPIEPRRPETVLFYNGELIICFIIDMIINSMNDTPCLFGALVFANIYAQVFGFTAWRVVDLVFAFSVNRDVQLLQPLQGQLQRPRSIRLSGEATWWVRHRHWRRSNSANRIFYGVLLIWHILISASLWSTQDLGRGVCKLPSIFYIVFLTCCIIWIIIIIWGLCKLRGLNDNFGLAFELRWNLFFVLIAFIINIIFSDLPELAPLKSLLIDLVAGLAIANALVIPVYNSIKLEKSLLQQRQGHQHNSSLDASINADANLNSYSSIQRYNQQAQQQQHQSSIIILVSPPRPTTTGATQQLQLATFEQIFIDDEIKRMFWDFLNNEFNTENMLFLEKVKEYRSKVNEYSRLFSNINANTTVNTTTTTPGSLQVPSPNGIGINKLVDDAKQIHLDFIVPEAKAQVNLPSTVCSAIEGQISSLQKSYTVVDPEQLIKLYDKAEAEILKLLKSDVYPRFRLHLSKNSPYLQDETKR